MYFYYLRSNNVDLAVKMFDRHNNLVLFIKIIHWKTFVTTSKTNSGHSSPSTTTTETIGTVNGKVEWILASAVGTSSDGWRYINIHTSSTMQSIGAIGSKLGKLCEKSQHSENTHRNASRNRSLPIVVSFSWYGTIVLEDRTGVVAGNLRWGNVVMKLVREKSW